MIEIHFINNLLGSFFSFTNQIIKIIFTQITKIKSQITKIIISLMEKNFLAVFLWRNL